MGAVIQIHPVPGIGGPTNREYYLWNAFANPAETALTASHMILSGLLEEYPDLKIFLFHGGGHLPYQIGRLDRAYEMRDESSAKIGSPPQHLPQEILFRYRHSFIAGPGLPNRSRWRRAGDDWF